MARDGYGAGLNTAQAVTLLLLGAAIGVAATQLSGALRAPGSPSSGSPISPQAWLEKARDTIRAKRDSLIAEID